ncbi:MAG TPA: hypothetical protein VGF69_13805 [Thermoanaerobaculia bacterium]
MMRESVFLQDPDRLGRTAGDNRRSRDRSSNRNSDRHGLQWRNFCNDCSRSRLMIPFNSKIVSALQRDGKLCRERLFVLADEVSGQVVDIEVLEQETLGQRPKVRFQSSDDLQHMERIDSQFAERRRGVKVRAH